MKCPACQNEMAEKTVADVTVDVCDGGCGGLWFDQGEFRRFDEPHEPAGELLDVRPDPNVKPSHERLSCPRCDNLLLMTSFFSVRKEVEIDECPGCAGVFLDAGELAHIRTLFQSEEERRSAADAYVSQVMGQDLAKMQKESEQAKDQARRFANALRFVCPSNYVSGKQDWGAF